MTSLPSSSCSIQSRKLAPILVALATALLLTGCEDKHIGRPCELGVPIPKDPTLITVNPQALECPSRICILPAQLKSTDTGPFCTDQCASDDDCTGAETSAGDSRCNSRFVCRRILPKLDNNPLSCKAVCVCFDFLPTGDGNQIVEVASSA